MGPASRDGFLMENQISEAASLDHRVSFELTTRDVTNCFEKHLLVFVELIADLPLLTSNHFQSLTDLDHSDRGHQLVTGVRALDQPHSQSMEITTGLCLGTREAIHSLDSGSR